MRSDGSPAHHLPALAPRPRDALCAIALASIWMSACEPPLPPAIPPAPEPPLVAELASLGCESRTPPPKIVTPEPAPTAPPTVMEMKDGKAHGAYITYHPNGKKRVEGRHVDGLADGVFRQWDPEGRLIGEFEMKAGTGTFMAWCDNGRLSQRVEMVGGRTEGSYEIWTCHGQKTRSGMNHNGQQEGVWHERDEAGRLLSEDRYSASVRDGECAQYYPDRGLTQWWRTYRRGKLEGPAAWYDALGQKVAEGAFRDGQPAGTWTAYFAGGKRRAAVVFDAKAPSWTTWDQDGKQVSRAEMDAAWRIVRLDGKDARGSCLSVRATVATELSWGPPLWVQTLPATPCEAPAQAVIKTPPSVATAKKGAK